MTPAGLAVCLDLLGWTQRGLARKLQRQEGTVRQWLRGATSIPADVAAWLEKMANFHARNPPPVGNRK